MTGGPNRTNTESKLVSLRSKIDISTALNFRALGTVAFGQQRTFQQPARCLGLWPWLSCSFKFPGPEAVGLGWAILLDSQGLWFADGLLKDLDPVMSWANLLGNPHSAIYTHVLLGLSFQRILASPYVLFQYTQVIKEEKWFPFPETRRSNLTPDIRLNPTQGKNMVVKDMIDQLTTLRYKQQIRF